MNRNMNLGLLKVLTLYEWRIKIITSICHNYNNLYWLMKILHRDLVDV